MLRDFSSRFSRFGMPLVLALSLLPGCGRKASPPEDAALHAQLAGEPMTLDPALAEDGLSLRVLGNVMDGLVGYDSAGKLELRLAESYELSSDGLRYTFILRPQAKWSDGKRVEASQFVAGIRRALSPQAASKTADFLLAIRGAQAFHAGKSQDLPGVRDQEGKLVVELKRPARYFLHAFALSATLPSRPDVLASHGGSWPVGRQAQEAFFTGPYRIISHEADRRIVLEKNPFYWGAPPKIPRIELDIIRDETTAVNLFDHGKLDIATRVPTWDYGRLKQQGVLHADPFIATYYLAFNCRKPPFSDRDWRRAVAGSISKKELVDALQTGEIPARSWVPRGLEGYLPFKEEERGFESSVARTRAALSQAKTAPRVEAVFDSSDRNALVMEKVQQDLKKNLGLRINLSNLDWKSHIRALQADPAPIYRFAWLAPFADPITHLLVFTTGNPNNYTGCSMPEYDALVRRIETAAPGPQREQLIRDAQFILVEREAVVVPLYHYTQVHAVRPRVRNFRVSPFGMIRFSELELESR